jgi:hypothetical protein
MHHFDPFEKHARGGVPFGDRQLLPERVVCVFIKKIIVSPKLGHHSR